MSPEQIMSNITPRAAKDESRFCPGCGYDLRGIDSERCPECGMVIDWGAVFSPIVWEYRRRVGWVRAFLRTLVLATFNPKKIAAASAGPVDYRSAQRFRWILVIVASVPLIGLLLGAIWKSGGMGFLNAGASGTTGLFNGMRGVVGPNTFWQFSFAWSAGATFLPILPVGILLAIYFCTGITEIWFRSGSMRAVAISRYACAAAGWMMVPAVCLVCIWIIEAGKNPSAPMTEARVLVAILGLGVIPLLWGLNTLRMLKDSTRPSAMRMVAAGATIPLMWGVCAAVGLFVFPIVAGLLWIMFDSLR